MNNVVETRTLDSWRNNPRFQETINDNPFRTAVNRAFDGNIDPDPLSPFAQEKEPLENKIAKLIPHKIIVPAGDVIYIMDDRTPIPLNEGMDLLRAYLSVSMKDTEKAAHILEQNFMGRWPVTTDSIQRDSFTISYKNSDLAGLTYWNNETWNLVTNERLPIDMGTPHPITEFGMGTPEQEHIDLLAKVFKIWNDAIGEEHFFEKLCLYPLRQRFREKAFILNGTGGDGKGIFTNLLQRMYGHLMLSNAPVPSFTGHDRFTATRSFIGKRFIAFNDVEDPSQAFMEWLKPMTTGNMMVKEIGSSSLVTMPCVATFMLETNFQPEFLTDNSHIRRFILRSFPAEFELNEYLTDAELDTLGERGDITAADMVAYLLSVDVECWHEFPQRDLPEPEYFALADEVENWTRTSFSQFCKLHSLSGAQRQLLKRKLEKDNKLYLR